MKAYIVSIRTTQLLILIILLLYFSITNYSIHQFDFSVNYLAIKILRLTGANSYDPEQMKEHEHLVFTPQTPFHRFTGAFYSFVSPPAVFYIYYPFTFFQFTSARFGWLLLNILLLWVSINLVAEDRIVPLLLYTLLFSQCSYIAMTLGLGQSNIILLLIMTQLLVKRSSLTPLPTGFLLALLTSFKVFPVLLVMYYLGKRQFRVLFWTLVLVIVINIPAILIIGPHECLDWIVKIVPTLSKGNHSYLDQGIPTLIARFTSDSGTSSKYFMIIAFGLIIVSTFYSFLRNVMIEPDADHERIEFGLWVTLSLIVSPLCWLHYHTLLLITFYSFLEYWGKQFSLAPLKTALHAIVPISIIFFLFYPDATNFFVRFIGFLPYSLSMSRVLLCAFVLYLYAFATLLVHDLGRVIAPKKFEIAMASDIQTELLLVAKPLSLTIRFGWSDIGEAFRAGVMQVRHDLTAVISYCSSRRARNHFIYSIVGILAFIVIMFGYTFCECRLFASRDETYDLGQESASQFLGIGWCVTIDRLDPEQSYRLIIGKEAVIRFAVHRKVDHFLSIDGWVPFTDEYGTQLMVVFVNNHKVGSGCLHHQPMSLTFPVSASHLKSGENVLYLKFRLALEPIVFEPYSADIRPISAAITTITITEQEDNSSSIAKNLGD